MVVSTAPQHAGQTIVAASATDLDRAARRCDHELKDHLRIEADPPAKTQVELYSAGFYTFLSQLLDEIVEVRNRSRCELDKGSVEPLEHRLGGPAQFGKIVKLVAHTSQNLRERVIELPLTPQATYDLVSRTTAGNIRDKLAK